MVNPLISVIMLAYNRDKYIAGAIESILTQTHENLELLIIDNNSTDNTPEMLSQYAKKDSRIRLFRSNNSNIGAGRNLGLDNARGDFFAFIDDDDYCEADYLEFLLNLIEIHNADIAVCGSNYDIGGEIKPKYVFDELVLCDRLQAVSNFLLRKYFNSGNPTKLFRRTAPINKIRYTEGDRYDDIHTMYRFFVAVGEKNVSVAAKGEPKYVFRRHDENNSTAVLDHSKLSREWLTEYLSAYRKRTKYISSELPELAELAKWSEWSFMISMVVKIDRFNVDGCSELYKYMSDELWKHRKEFITAKWTRDFEREWMEKHVK